MIQDSWYNVELVGGCIPTPLKHVSSSVGMIIPNICKNRKCSKPPTREIIEKKNTNNTYDEKNITWWFSSIAMGFSSLVLLAMCGSVQNWWHTKLQICGASFIPGLVPMHVSRQIMIFHSPELRSFWDRSIITHHASEDDSEVKTWFTPIFVNDDHPINHITKNDDLSLPSLMSKGFLTPFFFQSRSCCRSSTWKSCPN